MYKYEPFYSFFQMVKNLIDRLTVFRLAMVEWFDEDFVDEEPQALNNELRQILVVLDSLATKLRAEGYLKAGEELPEDLKEAAQYYE